MRDFGPMALFDARHLLPLSLGAVTALITSTPRRAAAEGGFVHRTVTVESRTFKYQVFVPAQWTKDKKWPVILFLHGSGERGADGRRQTDEGLPRRLRNQSDFPAIVVMPQCRRRQWWWDRDMEAQAFQALSDASQEFNGDPDRTYLTGLSMGGYAAWAFGYKYPDRFAAIVPVCGGVTSRRGVQPPDWHPASRAPDDPYRETARALRSVPIWAFHGAADRTVPVSESRKLSAALKALDAEVQYTEYPGVPHNSWDRAYAEPELIPWLLSQTRSR